MLLPALYLPLQASLLIKRLPADFFKAQTPLLESKAFTPELLVREEGDGEGQRRWIPACMTLFFFHLSLSLPRHARVTP